jgi:PEP-CTERM motif-containing protein
MNRPLRFLLTAAILGASAPGLASADPVTITSGVIFVPRSTVVFSPIVLEGTDGTLGFSFVGSINPDSSIGVRSCTVAPCLPGTAIPLYINSAGSDLRGMLTYGVDSYEVGGISDTVGSVVLEISGLAMLPPAPTFTNQLATITAPFQIDRAFFRPPGIGGPFGPGTTLLGSGTATVSLFADDTAGDLRWGLSLAEYRFEEQAPIPEPASFVLLGSGLIGMAMRVKRKKDAAAGSDG